MPDKTYSEEQYRKILKRAAELESERLNNPSGDAAGGLTLDEIAEAASGSGIDPQLIYRAANEIDKGGSSGSNQKEAAVLENDLYVERLIEAEADHELIDAIVAELNHRYRESDEEWYGNKPSVKRYGKSVEWSQTDEWETYERRVLLQPVGKKLRIRISKRNLWSDSWGSSTTSLAIIFPVLLVAVIGLGTVSDMIYNSFVLGVIAAAILGAAGIPFYRHLEKKKIEKHKLEVETIANDLVTQVLLLKQEGEEESKTRSESMDKIELPDDEKAPGEGERKLPNNLRERN